MNERENVPEERAGSLLWSEREDPCGLSVRKKHGALELLRSLLTDPLNSSALILNWCQVPLSNTAASGGHLQNKRSTVKRFGAAGLIIGVTKLILIHSDFIFTPTYPHTNCCNIT